jgi:transcriptional regulator with XRE-family HTH domain
MNIDSKSIGDRIKEVREFYNYSQQKLADYLGVSKRSVLEYEGNKRTPPLSFVLALNACLGINPDWLLEGKGGMHDSYKDPDDEYAKYIDSNPNMFDSDLLFKILKKFCEANNINNPEYAARELINFYSELRKLIVNSDSDKPTLDSVIKSNVIYFNKKSA